MTAQVRRRRRVALAIAAGLVASTLSGLSAAASPGAREDVVSPDPGQLSPPDRPNIVLVLADDLSTDLVPHMGQVQRLAAEGVLFDSFFVTDSQCCPSRASTLSGKHPHNSRVLTNGGPLGGFQRFMENDLETSMGPFLQEAGYRTGFMGKFMNGYQPEGIDDRRSQPGETTYGAGYVPPGWDEWHVAGRAGYAHFDYTLATAIDTEAARLEDFGAAEEDYLSDVLATRAEEFVARAVPDVGADHDPFFLMVAPFGVHTGGKRDPAGAAGGFPPAPRDRPATDADDRQWPERWDRPDFPRGDCGGAAGGGCRDIQFPPAGTDAFDPSAFNEVPADPPAWMARSPLTEKHLDGLAEKHLDRVRMAQSVDDVIGRIRAQLVAAGVEDETYIVFNSDNGFHLGQHALGAGKLTAYDHDIRVPLIIRPPGGTEPRTVSAISQNTDLLPTFVEIAGGATTGRQWDGASLLPLIRGEAAPESWRDGALVEYTSAGRAAARDDPDRQRSRTPPTYDALRTAEYLYVDYSRDTAAIPRGGEAELYDLRSDPGQQRNVYRDLDARTQRALHRALNDYVGCAADGCQQVAGELPALP